MKPAVIEIMAHRTRDPMAQQQSLAHLLAPQIDVAEAQPHLLAHVLVELEGQRLGAVENLELLAQDLDLPRLQMRVGGTRRAGTHQTR